MVQNAVRPLVARQFSISSSTKYGVQKYSAVVSKANRSGGTISTTELQDESGQELGSGTMGLCNQPCVNLKLTRKCTLSIIDF
jgi:hypothetical protein